ncbi:E3 ubiquitin-protein ligase TRIM33-like [Drosophila hydei]|uniref:E3 ubiquitin-protein ligase TRIM33-like n=1 Tax=Drosophila hydei TaxID=7224 RepID=A0A6J1MEB9_DROHY|nr:E3 ubiquitin-protein ligase TRIM33-like [Drosophila hydei]XP_023177670.1 E3 ubiquitin-protein ligase TRIM33-like [Drosophila hydei]XP_023177671.1 E3 ubiquitin-protein ligase TRIM33-like [Drosophila hydei]
MDWSSGKHPLPPNANNKRLTDNNNQSMIVDLTYSLLRRSPRSHQPDAAHPLASLNNQTDDTMEVPEPAPAPAPAPVPVPVPAPAPAPAPPPPAPAGPIIFPPPLANGQKQSQDINLPADITESDEDGKHHAYECPICLENVSGRQPATTKCGHVFCYGCILSVLRVNHKCPICSVHLATRRAIKRIYI